MIFHSLNFCVNTCLKYSNKNAKARETALNSTPIQDKPQNNDNRLFPRLNRPNNMTVIYFIRKKKNKMKNSH